MSEPFADERWEYSLEYITTDANQEQAFLQENFAGQNLPRFAVYAALPRLNAIGEGGWELVQMEPVVVGKNGDVLISAVDSGKWTNIYFCVFKRRKA
jgi:hypothetical protein